MKVYLSFYRFLNDRKGLSLVEYALVGALISATAIVALTTLGTEVSETIGIMGDSVETAKDSVLTT